jgi:hypothetical protein
VLPHRAYRPADTGDVPIEATARRGRRNSRPQLHQRNQRRQRRDSTVDTELDEFGHVNPSASQIAPRNPYWICRLWSATAHRGVSEIIDRSSCHIVCTKIGNSPIEKSSGYLSITTEWRERGSFSAILHN